VHGRHATSRWKLADLTNYQWIDDDRRLVEVCESIASAERVAIDTEFHRERTYFPELALVQIAAPSGVYLIDPLACDVSPLAEVFARSTITWLAHASQQDLEVLEIATGSTPSTIFDTQIAAGFIGMSTPSLASLVSSKLGINLSKGDRLTDWMRRPLTPAQCTYAANDVIHLDEVYALITKELEQLERLEWAIEACREALGRRPDLASSDDAWLKVKDARSLKGEARGVAQAVAKWRDLRARELNVPVRRILSDMALVSIAQQAPRTSGELMGLRGVDGRLGHGSDVNELLAAVATGKETKVVIEPSSGEDVDKRLKPAVTLVTAWISELARQQRIDTALLGTRADVDALLRRDPHCRLVHGWRRDIVGGDLEDILAGRAGLSFDGKGHLRLIRE